jgi:uncharacterized membrane protein YdjX (TVP38/TMEM64 family)
MYASAADARLWYCRFVAYGVVYTLLEVLALPAIPLTMTAGIIFGVVPGTAIVSVSATAAAAISFVIARYLARDKVCYGQTPCLFLATLHVINTKDP